MQDKKEPPSAAVVLQVAKAVNGHDGKPSSPPAPASQPAPSGGDAKVSAGPSQQPAMANPPDKKATAKAAGATPVSTAGTGGVHASSASRHSFNAGRLGRLEQFHLK